MAVLSVPMVGSLVQTNDSWEPFRLVDPTGAVVDAASAFFRDLQAAGEVGSNGSVLRDGSTAVVPVLVGDRGSVAAGHSGRGSRLFAVDAGGRKATSSALATADR